MEVIVPAAGLSTRFPNMKPKYLHFGYDNKMMLVKAVEPFRGKYNITVVVLKEHVEKYNAYEFIKNELPEAAIVMVNEPTRGPAETVLVALEHILLMRDDIDFQFLVKDCDSFFNHRPMNTNYVCVSNIAAHETLNKLASKSFVKYNDQNIITDIIEKQVVSDSFCVGGYKFGSAEQYMHTYDKLKNRGGELFVSHIIQDMLENGTLFNKVEVTDYTDVGTADDWHKYNDMPVLFCDIDGTLIKAQSRYGSNSYDTAPVILQENVNRIREYHDKGCQIFFTTARPDEYRDVTLEMLRSLGFTSFRLITGLYNARRVLINDYNTSNPYPRAEAINIYRDHDNLKDFL
jgi:dTDP-glucose pyrophosphorylase